MRILFYLPNHTGHHFAYLSRQLPGFLELPVEVVVAITTRGLESNEYTKLLKRFEQDVTFAACCTAAPRGSLKNAKHRLRELVKAIETFDPDHVIVEYVDGMWEVAYANAVVGRRPWPRQRVVEAWLYRDRGVFGDRRDQRLRARLKRRMFVGLLKQGLFRRIYIDHELLYNYVLPIAVRTPTEVVLPPNPIVLKPMVAKEAARKQFGLALDGPWISLSGMIARYKGAYLLLEAYRRRREKMGHRAGRLLLAGPHEDGIRALLRQAPYDEWVAEGGIQSVDRFLDEDEMYLAAASADLVTAPYPHHTGRSSIVLWAAAAGRPSLGAQDGCMGHVIREHELGMTCDVLDPAMLADTMGSALERPWTDDDVRRVRKYAEFHRVENYRQVASSLVRHRLEQDGVEKVSMRNGLG